MTRPLLAAAAVLAVLALPGPAAALTCPEAPVERRIEQADVAFVGRMVAERPVGEASGVEQRVYTFLVDQEVKGDPEREVEVRAALLTDAEERPLERDVAVGVLATEAGGVLATTSCGLLDPGALLAAADEPRGTGIKIVIGLVILGAAVALAARRLRRRQDAERVPRV